MRARLEGQVILNTRPVHQQAELSALLEAEGARVLSFPVIEIVTADPGAIDTGAWDVMLFVSRNAVDGAFAALGDRPLPRSMQLGVIGAATRRALLERVGGRGPELITSEPYNSEALLAADELRHVAGKRILIMRGQRGRNLLGDELARRGASVDYCEVYRRMRPRRDFSDFDDLVAPVFPTLALLTSNEGMSNLLELVDAPAASRLRRIPWLLISERMRESALKLRHNAPIIIARGASDEGIQQAICEWVDRR